MNNLKLIITALFIFTFQLTFSVDLKFSFTKSNELKTYSKTTVSLTLPNNTTSEIYSDTTAIYNKYINGFYSDKGKVLIKVQHLIASDTFNLEYELNINGSEKRIEIDVSLYNNIEKEWNSEKWITTNKFYSNSIIIKRIHFPQDSVIIEPVADLLIGKEPIFRIVNKSNTTIKGEWLDGYFWGCIEKQFDNKWVAKRCGVIDTEFLHKEPLNKGDTSLTHVGSFGDYKATTVGKYKYSVYYSGNSNSESTLIKKSKKFKFRAETKEYFELEYLFEIQ